MDDRTAREIPRVAVLIARADELVITAGAGMSVDSGLPDFRGSGGFWRTYPPLVVTLNVDGASTWAGTRRTCRSTSRRCGG